MEEIKLVYFNIRGLAEPVRWMLKMSGVDFIDERIPLDAWTTKRRKGSLDNLLSRRRASDTSDTGVLKRFVGQLPIVFIGNDVVLTQPLCVLRYLAKRCNFCPSDEMQEARAEEISDLVYDLRLRAMDYEGKAFKSATPDISRHTVFRDFKSSPDTKEKSKMKDDFRLLYFPLYFSKFNDLLVSSKGEWVCGDNISYGDLVLANFLDIAEDMMDPTCLDEFPKLRELKKKVLAIPEIEAWRRSQELLMPGTGSNGYPENN